LGRGLTRAEVVSSPTIANFADPTGLRTAGELPAFSQRHPLAGQGGGVRVEWASAIEMADLALILDRPQLADAELQNAGGFTTLFITRNLKSSIGFCREKRRVAQFSRN